VSPRTVDKDEWRREILWAATRAFARKGYAATKVEDIAREAGVAKGTVYIYFSSRDEILLAAFETFVEEMLAGVREALETDVPALARLCSVVRAVLSGMEVEPDLSRVVLDFWAAGSFEDGSKGIDFGRIYDEYRGLVAGLLEETRQEGTARHDLPEDAPAVMVGTIEGVLLQWIVDPEAVPLGRMAEPVLDVLLAGLAIREAP
jgi:TetR/AcrR family fatty acid metabolism transcriptional regulator